MKIATWNLERPTQTAAKLTAINEELKRVNADILILTETNTAVDPGEGYTAYHTGEVASDYYKPGERRVSIYSKYPMVGQVSTFNPQISICISFKTPLGELAVYGTIIGIQGNRRDGFKEDLDKQLQDFSIIAATHNLCIAGDLNMSFSDNYYHTNEGREKLVGSFNQLKLVNTTAGIANNIDHIILPEAFIAGRTTTTEIWNEEKGKLSDHIGVVVTIKE